MYLRAHVCHALLRAVERRHAAFCTIEVGFEVDWLCSFCIAVTIGAGAERKPRRHPVIAYVFESEPTISKRSFTRATNRPKTAGQCSSDRRSTRRK